jgi:ubiquinone/menaquinone biosynthesis C-methylase UbiE
MMRLTEIVHQILSDHLQPGDQTIDATAGNGHDTLFLAGQVGSGGKVIAIDIQDEAIASTRIKIEEAELSACVELHVADHAVKLPELATTRYDRVAAITFNLGYLPGSDKAIQTQSDSTKRALDASMKLLRHGGVLCVTAYRGHPGGLEESKEVEEWMSTARAAGHSVDSHVPKSNNTPPILWVLRKTA